MGLCVTVAHGKHVRSHTVPLPGLCLPDEEVHISINPSAYVARHFATHGHIQHEWQYDDQRIVVAVPETFTLLTTPQESQSLSTGSEAQYLFEGYYQSNDTRYGILGQLLCATREPNCVHPHRKRHRSAYTSCHAHPVQGSPCPGIHEVFYPLFGQCTLWTSQAPRHVLTEPTIVPPGVFHQLRSDTMAINLLCMHHLPAPYRVREAPHIPGERHRLVCQQLIQECAA